MVVSPFSSRQSSVLCIGGLTNKRTNKRVAAEAAIHWLSCWVPVCKLLNQTPIHVTQTYIRLAGVPGACTKASNKKSYYAAHTASLLTETPADASYRTMTARDGPKFRTKIISSMPWHMLAAGSTCCLIPLNVTGDVHNIARIVM